MRKSIRYRHAHARRKQLRRLSVEQCESRYCLSAIGFSAHDIIKTDVISPRDVQAADIDGDGDLDFLVASYGTIAWYENVDGAGSVGPQQVITTRAVDAELVTVGDIDGDGDLDVLSASSQGNKIAWYENADGEGSFGPQQVITTDADHPKSVTVGDLDGDGDLDVLSASSWDNRIAWYENTDQAGGFGPQHIIASDMHNAQSVTVGDIDDDGDLDVVAASFVSPIAWYENIDGAGNFGSQQVIAIGGVTGARSITLGDLDGDGDLDLLAASHGENKLAWYENTNGTGNFHPHQIGTIIGIEWEFDVSLAVGDMDGDGDLDFLVASFGTIAWHENTDGAGHFSLRQSITTVNFGGLSATAGDIDGDGDLDVLAASDDGNISWYENNDDAAGSFGLQQVITAGAFGAEAVTVGDLDRDGDLDVLSASWVGNTIAWHENIDGAGSFGPQQVITRKARGANSVTVGDLDGDGDLDVVSASFDDNKIAWYENADGQGSFEPQQVITTEANRALSVAVGDLDGDGDLDVLSASRDDNKVAWYENTDGAGGFGPQQVITIDTDRAWSVTVGDIDGDGDLDVLSASSRDNKIAWYENTDGAASFGRQQVITTEANGAESVAVGDLDGDGDLDVLSTSLDDDKIAWYENTDGAGSFGPQQVISIGTIGPESVTVGDLDGDGDLDVLSTASLLDSKIAWYENTDGAGSFGPELVVGTGGASSTALADVDGDGDLDVLLASPDDDQIAWHGNLGGSRGIAKRHVIIAPAAKYFPSMTVADLDGDGDLDVLLASADDDKIAWYENTDGAGSFGPQRVITTLAGNARSVAVGDLNGDGDLDVLSASDYGNKIAWYENTDGVGSFGVPQTITTDSANWVTVGDMDGDGDLDVLSASSQGNKIAWYENVDGEGSFRAEQVITRNAPGDKSVAVGDLDGDGDLDVLADSADGKTSWYENTNGLGSFGSQQLIARTTRDYRDLRSVAVADLDGDGDLDVVPAFADDDKVAWYENTDGAGSFGPQQIITSDTRGAGSVTVGDIDGDGDVDVLSRDNKIAWYENTDGAGSFGPRQMISTSGASAAALADVDGDGDLDVLLASWGKIAWYENRLAGDTDDDGEVDFGDFGTLAENFGKTDATWEMGDFDGDGQVQFADFVILAENFGETRANEEPARSSASAARAAAAEQLFSQPDEFTIAWPDDHGADHD